MPVTITRSGYDIALRLKQKIESPDLILELGQALSDDIGLSFVASGLRSKTGSALDAITDVGTPQRSGAGWSIGVGNAGRTGRPGGSAPRGVLEEFLRDNDLGPRYWKYIPKLYKDKLEMMRRAGMYGGRGPDYANYVWAQERGNGRALIPARGFIEAGLGRWMSRASGIVGGYFAKGT